MKVSFDSAVTATLLCAAAGLFAATFTDQFDVPTFGGDIGPAMAPRGFLAVWMLMAAIALLQSLRQTPEPAAAFNRGKLSAAILVACGTAVAMTTVGFVFAAIPGFFLFCWSFGYRKRAVLVSMSIAAPLLVWALFTFAFELLLPRSPWFHLI